MMRIPLLIFCTAAASFAQVAEVQWHAAGSDRRRYEAHVKATAEPLQLLIRPRNPQHTLYIPYLDVKQERRNHCLSQGVHSSFSDPVFSRCETRTSETQVGVSCGWRRELIKSGGSVTAAHEPHQAVAEASIGVALDRQWKLGCRSIRNIAL